MKKTDSIPFLTTAILFMAIMAIAPLSSQGQVENHLILKKRGYINKMHFLPGDPITIIRAGLKSPEEIIIEGIGEDFILVSGQELLLNQIDCVVKRYTGFNFIASGRAVMAAAPVYLLVGVINSLFQRTSPVPTPTNLIVAGSLLAAGAVIPTFQVRRYRLGGKFTLRVVKSDPQYLR